MVTIIIKRNIPQPVDLHLHLYFYTPKKIVVVIVEEISFKKKYSTRITMDLEMKLQLYPGQPSKQLTDFITESTRFQVQLRNPIFSFRLSSLSPTTPCKKPSS